MPDAPLVTTKIPAVKHTYLVEPCIRVRQDWNTKQIEVTGLLGIAPDSTTIIEYPVHVWNFGYWNRTTTRKVLAEVKKTFLAECRRIGYTKKDFTRPLEIDLFWKR